MSNFKCALSGQCPISDPVALPTGQICSKSLLLKKLTETSNSNPFSAPGAGTQLDESQLIELSALPGDQVVPPVNSSSNSIPSILQTLSSEYDALVLELFDTRKALEETRKELSHALYQNDAAVRVIARVVMERDVARKELQASLQSGSSVSGNVSESSNKRKRIANDAADGNANVNVVPADSDEAQASSDSSIPAAVKGELKKTWEKLCSTRKAKTKATETYASVDDISKFQVNKKSYHKTSAKGIVSLAGTGEQSEALVSSSKDKNLTFYDLNSEKVLKSISAKVTAAGSNLLHSVNDTIAMLGSDGMIRVILKDSDSVDYKTIDVEAELTNVVGIKVHPTGSHLFAAEKSGTIHLYEIITGEDASVKKVASWSGVDGDTQCSSIGIHPDGLILGIGREDGNISLWDLNTEKLATTLESDSGAIKAIEFSEKGVHLASISEGTVTVWDLRKQKSIASIDHEGKVVECVAFCPIGKYLAFGTVDGEVVISVVKNWDTKVVLSDGKGKVTGLVWGSEAKSLASSNDTSRIVKLWSN